MVPDGNAVREAVLDALPASRAARVVIDMSSSDPLGTAPWLLGKFSKNVPMVDAPVSGAVVKAKDGTLAIMAGGEKPAFQKVLPVLQAMGTEIFHGGPLGAGHAVKALNNYLGAAGTLAGFEALLIAQASGSIREPMMTRSTPPPAATARRRGKSAGRPDRRVRFGLQAGADDQRRRHRRRAGA